MYKKIINNYNNFLNICLYLHPKNNMDLGFLKYGKGFWKTYYLCSHY